MQPQAPYLGDPGAYEALVYDFVMEPAAQVLALDDDHLVVRTRHGPVIVARLSVTGESTLAGLVTALKGAGVVVVLAGGSAAEGAGIVGSAAWSAAPAVTIMQVTDDGSVLPELAGGSAGAVRGWILARAPIAPDWPRFYAQLAHQSALKGREMAGVQARLLARTPWVTRSLVGLMTAIFLVELLIRAPTDAGALGSMGALSQQSVAAGEYWRMLTATMLHGSVLHAAVNLYVLWRLGDLVERVFGPERTLILYVLAAVGGSAVSLVFLGDYTSVGASGAIWGLMAAQLVLGVAAAGKLPSDLRQRMRAGAGQNLILNLLISFAPGIDWGAHLGGAVVGGVGAWLLTASLPAWPEGGAPAPDRVSVALRGGGFAAAALFGVALLKGLERTLQGW
ncbi:MAG: rhomboid family intramembrane serine protease [Myxococcales bacterium]|nr:rhomboid family intramembrane serine protease [Myxococcales bacterium]